MNPVNSFQPVMGEQPRVLILGSMPGVRSLEQQRYYAHPRNAFWPIISALLQQPLPENYSDRLQMLCNGQLAVWDVIAQCYREGSLDSAIEADQLVFNPIDQLIEQHPSIEAIAVNGGAAHSWLKRGLRSKQLNFTREIEILSLTSTSPANARLNFEQKLANWQSLLNYLPNPVPNDSTG